MAFDLALAYPSKIRGVLAFSGRLLNESRKHHAPASEVQQVQFFLSHGRYDDKLPAFHADEALSFLRTLGILPHYEVFEGGHEISMSSLVAARQWLTKQP
ncbi:alpha/beta hydrolase [Hymenobacter radiodurans]|uniref:alpha/beta hydrolase n=1 Tax=Hymenobacter radiodurans TaxID=2496028 RepID=UPI00105893D6